MYVFTLGAVLIQVNQQYYCHYYSRLLPAGQGILTMFPCPFSIVVVISYECVKMFCYLLQLEAKAHKKQLTNQMQEEEETKTIKKTKQIKLGQQRRI